MTKMKNEHYTGSKTERNARRFCSEDISLIENYEQAKADNFKGWCIHHRLEYLLCQQRWVSKKELLEKGIYYNRPAWELIFMKNGEHSKFHRQDPNWKAKNAEAVRNSEKRKEAAIQNIKKAQEAAWKSEKFKQNIKKAYEACRKPFEIDGIRFETRRDAAKHFGVGQTTIFNWLHNPDKYNRVCRYL